MLRSVIQPDKENIDPNANPAAQMKPLVSSRMAKELIQSKKFKAVQKHIVGQFVSQHCVQSTSIQETLDSLGVSKKGYTAIQKTMSTMLRAQGIKPNILPTPASVWMHRQELNSKQAEYIGELYHINGEYSSKEGIVLYNEDNNIFVDLELLLQRMVEFYDLSISETSGTLEVVLKLDECEILKDKKMERVTITLMNRALNKCGVDDPKYFSVQSETNVWWLGSFMVGQERSS